ncbi:MAG: hypothetical protein M1483_06165 [Actinobacteria bacterium]|jgi:hypothetical protein|nr:hypothetical protein [Actinomycetota bacterium]MCL6105192.1 hypothetical protein [Actinomycetota bacterium]
MSVPSFSGLSDDSSHKELNQRGMLLTLVVEPGDEWKGLIVTSDGQQFHFEGWISLMAAVDRLRTAVLGPTKSKTADNTET